MKSILNLAKSRVCNECFWALITTLVGDAKARVEVDLTKALNSLAATEEGGCKSKAGIAHLKVELALVEDE